MSQGTPPIGSENVLPGLRRAFWIGAAALTAIGLTFALISWLNQRTVALVLESQATGRLAREARALAVDRETSIRGYLLSRQQISLAPEFAARESLARKLDSLVLLTREYPPQMERARSIRTAVDRWERGWARPALDPAKASASPIREDLAGKELFDSIRAAFDSFINAHQEMFASRVRRLDVLQAFSVALILLDVALLLGVLWWLSRRSMTQARLLIEQHEELEDQAMDLQSQTAELEAQALDANRAVTELGEANSRLEATIRRLEDAESTVTKAQSRQQETQSLLDMVLNNSPVGVALYGEDRRIVRVNAALAAITGIPAADHCGKTTSDLTDEELAGAADAFMQRVLATGESAVNMPLTGSTKALPKKERHFLCSFFPVMLPGHINGAGAIVLETTHYRQLEEQLLQAQKMEAVGRLAGGVAHDFNNMLTAITSYCDLILSDLPPDSPQRPDMLEIAKAAEKATALTRKLLAFSRQQVLRPQRVNLNSTIDSLQKTIKRLLGAGVELSLLLESRLPPVTADPIELERIIMNLVINSRDAMPDGGKLIIETSNVTIDEEYASTHADTKAGSYVMLAVTDTGSGMTRDVREKLFEPFFTTKEKGKGTGLGLPSVYGIVKQSGGFLWVYSEPGKGTTFKIYLPLAKDPESAKSTTPGRNRPVGAETILLVEDDDEVRQVATRILRRNGYHVLEAGNGADALRVCENQLEPVDLIVTDIVMPEMGGSELAQRIREKQPDARILFTSGYTEDAAVRQKFLHPGEAFIEKPFTPDALAKKAHDLLASSDRKEI